jgi:hypothetical protein
MKTKNADPIIDEGRVIHITIFARHGHNIERVLADHVKAQAP